MSCTHTWEPIPRWSGRYRCSDCGVIGYRGMRGGKEEYGPEVANAIIPYRCGHAVCRQPAIQVRKRHPITNKGGRFQRCLKHFIPPP